MYIMHAVCLLYKSEPINKKVDVLIYRKATQE